jgi:hypothetical protein
MGPNLGPFLYFAVKSNPSGSRPYINSPTSLLDFGLLGRPEKDIPDFSIFKPCFPYQRGSVNTLLGSFDNIDDLVSGCQLSGFLDSGFFLQKPFLWV